MSSYDIRGMQASGMTQQQINDYIKEQDAKIYGPKGTWPKGLPVKPQVMPPVKPRPIRTATGTPIKSLTSSAALRKFAPLLQQMKAQKSGVMGSGSQQVMKKGGAANHYTKGGKINLDACGVSTGKKSNKCAGW